MINLLLSESVRVSISSTNSVDQKVAQRRNVSNYLISNCPAKKKQNYCLGFAVDIKSGIHFLVMEAFWVWVLSLSTVSLICKYNVIPGSKHAFPFVKALPIIFLIRHMIDHSPAELLNKPIPELLSAPTIFFLQILVGLVLGLIGDLCLLKENVKNWFLVGLVSFLIGHIVYSYGLWSAASGSST